MKPFLQPCIIIILFESSIAWADEETDIVDTFGSQAMISQATGYSMPLDKVPAIATIVTDEDIKNIGARNLAQALDPVPGLQVVTGRGTNRLLSIRGIFADLGPDVLIKRNNVPISQGFFTTLNPFDLLPVNNIERIEIIRGPNSATDGADALAGVINIVTKPSTDYRGTEIGGRAGIHDTFDAWLTHGSRLGPSTSDWVCRFGTPREPIPPWKRISNRNWMY